jgi:hypothetical protein
LNVYVETNFVLELALAQEQYASCDEILALAEAGRVRLLIPAYSLIEPYETLRRRHQDRARVKGDLDREFGQLGRTASYAARLQGFREARALLVDSTDDEATRLESVRSRLLEIAEVIPLETKVMQASRRLQADVDLSPQDAIVLASVLSHLERTTPSASCFPNRNWRDFDDPSIVEKLKQHGCKLLPSFDDGGGYVRHVLSAHAT